MRLGTSRAGIPTVRFERTFFAGPVATGIVSVRGWVRRVNMLTEPGCTPFERTVKVSLLRTNGGWAPLREIATDRARELVAEIESYDPETDAPGTAQDSSWATSSFWIRNRKGFWYPTMSRGGVVPISIWGIYLLPA